MFAKDRSSETANQVPFTQKRKGGRLVIEDRMVRIVSANQITWTVIEPLYHGHILRRIYKIGWSELYQPIISLGQLNTIILRSHSSENLEDGMVRMASANQITGTVI